MNKSLVEEQMNEMVNIIMAGGLVMDEYEAIYKSSPLLMLTGVEDLDSASLLVDKIKDFDRMFNEIKVDLEGCFNLISQLEKSGLIDDKENLGAMIIAMNKETKAQEVMQEINIFKEMNDLKGAVTASIKMNQLIIKRIEHDHPDGLLEGDDLEDAMERVAQDVLSKIAKRDEDTDHSLN